MISHKSSRRYIRYLPLYGCISTGLIYLGIGVIAILSFLQLKQGGADESSMLAFLNDYSVGKMLVWIILLGTLSYIVWRIYEAIADPYDYGKSPKGIGKRIGIALSSIADALIAYTAIQILLGKGNVQTDGQPEGEREMVSNLLQHDLGSGLIILIGSIVLITAAIQFYYGVTRGYKERLDFSHFNKRMESAVHILAWVGYLARGIIIGIIGFSIVKAGVLENARHVVNTDKAFDFIGDHVGHVYFILVATGTICYGLFMFLLGLTYDTDQDKKIRSKDHRTGSI